MVKNNTFIMALGGAIVGVGVFAGVILYPLMQGIRSDRIALNERTQEMLNIQEEQRQLLETVQLLLLHKQEINHVEALFVQKDSPVDFFRFLDEQAQMFGLIIEKAATDPVRIEEERWYSAEVRLAGSGAYENVFLFLQKLEYAPYLIEITDFSMRQVGGRVGFSMRIRFFVQ